ncbi:MAG TPA: radical SAM family heme chaperone HemW [Clostridia bacterium]|jgi:oxygen-independent coproporphyrinogen-3 oxidase|nr:radical SAM family heme chaperone HemW [Clostridiaceae bacterium]HOF26006.1 radical SAM family heme chaperone HemW [Clostridia bacterium]HOM33551.1 radical SAM family heme chaperone HemW [Clostridia bacterium]HOR89183.1 radical SAM family heme chaperone HemW [Clostridia bacterium]HOT70119.1 radical SAM family heme chaperone HemW [Clostridia bacterium]
MNDLRIYIHIPFCKSKCNYCDFNSFAGMDHMFRPYFKSLITEIALYSNELRGRRIDSIYFGGGTPSHVDVQYIYQVLKCFTFDENTEITIEVNPGVVGYHNFVQYRQMGINRISFGIQSFNDRILMYMGRIHNSLTAINNIHECKEAGFDNISADMIFGYPKQTLEQYEDSLNVLKSLEIPHVSCYSLSIEPGTLLDEMVKKNVMPMPDEDLDRAMYNLSIESLKKANLQQYEISNFAVPGYESRHNIGYWNRDEYLGFGLSAHSLYNETRYSNTEDLHQYISLLNKYEKPVVHTDTLTKEEIITEYIILKLRMNSGLDIAHFQDKFDLNFEEKYGDKLKTLVNTGLLYKQSDSYKLTRSGMDVANKVFVEFV